MKYLLLTFFVFNLFGQIAKELTEQATTELDFSYDNNDKESLGISVKKNNQKLGKISLLRYDMDEVYIEASNKVVSNTCNERVGARCKIVYPLSVSYFDFAAYDKQEAKYYSVKYSNLSGEYDDSSISSVSYQKDVLSGLEDNFLVSNIWMSELFRTSMAISPTKPYLKCDSYDWFNFSSEGSKVASYLMSDFFVFNQDLDETVAGINDSIQNVKLELDNEKLLLSLKKNNISIGSITNNIDLKFRKKIDYSSEDLYPNPYCSISLRGSNSTFFNRTLPYIEDFDALRSQIFEEKKKNGYKNFVEVKPFSNFKNSLEEEMLNKSTRALSESLGVTVE